MLVSLTSFISGPSSSWKGWRKLTLNVPNFHGECAAILNNLYINRRV